MIVRIVFKPPTRYIVRILYVPDIRKLYQWSHACAVHTGNKLVAIVISSTLTFARIHGIYYAQLHNAQYGIFQ